MRRLKFLKAAVGLVAGVSDMTFAASRRKKPNFMFIIADDCTFHNLGYYGGQTRTPNIE